jgi:hypothetical protein
MSDPDLVRFTAKAVAFVVWGLLGTSILGTVGVWIFRVYLTNGHS